MLILALASQRISYAKSTSHATVAQTEGPEAVYAIKLGLRDADGADAGTKSRLTVSGAQKKLIDQRRQEKRGREDEEEEEEEDSDDEPERKKGRQEEQAQDDDDGAFAPQRFLHTHSRLAFRPFS